MLPIRNILSVETLSAALAVVFRSKPVKLNSKIGSACAVLIVEMETEDAFGVKFPKGVWPEESAVFKRDES